MPRWSTNNAAIICKYVNYSLVIPFPVRPNRRIHILLSSNLLTYIHTHAKYQHIFSSGLRPIVVVAVMMHLHPCHVVVAISPRGKNNFIVIIGIELLVEFRIRPGRGAGFPDHWKSFVRFHAVISDQVCDNYGNAPTFASPAVYQHLVSIIWI